MIVFAARDRHSTYIAGFTFCFVLCVREAESERKNKREGERARDTDSVPEGKFKFDNCSVNDSSNRTKE